MENVGQGKFQTSPVFTLSKSLEQAHVRIISMSSYFSLDSLAPTFGHWKVTHTHTHTHTQCRCFLKRAHICLLCGLFLNYLA